MMEMVYFNLEGVSHLNRNKLSCKDTRLVIFAYIVVGLFALICLYPFILVFAVSFSKEKLVAQNGFKLMPEQFSLDTYRYLFNNGKDWLLSSYIISILVTTLGTLASMIVTTALAYSLSLKKIKYRNYLSFFCYFTTIFSAGLVPWYIMCTKYYHLSNSLAGLILPYLVNVFFMIILRTNYDSIPDSMAESASIDGANDFVIFIKIILPLSRTAIVCVSMFYALQFWNDWYLSLMFISERHLYPLQLQLFNILTNVDSLTAQSAQVAGAQIALPAETLKMAVTVVTIGPIIFLYPVIQKYFIKGIMVGAVKG
jgi:putative aldouronate transport system permease protein